MTVNAFAANFAGNVRAERARLSLNQAQVADHMRAAGFSWHHQTVGQVEKCRRRVTVDELPALAEVLETTIARLLRIGPVA